MWDGFSEDDVQRLKKGECATKEQNQLPTASVAKRQATHLCGPAKKNIARERMIQRSKENSDCVPGDLDIPDNAKLSKPKKSEDIPEKSQMATTKMVAAVKDPQNSDLTLCDDKKVDTSGNQSTVCIKIKEGKNYEVVNAEKSPLESFQNRHKLMEEENRRRKELLAKALADRKKKTREEARRLQQIQEELQKLDALLSNDVGVLRNQIEAASLEFMDAQKRYDKAEKEFLEAKLNLFGKLERKELLTEHLCKIIEQNEMRKAKKLSELMDKLDLGSSESKAGEELTMPAASLILPSLCALDEVSYSACNTLKNRQSDSKDIKEITFNETENSRAFPTSVDTPPAVVVEATMMAVDGEAVPNSAAV